MTSAESFIFWQNAPSIHQAPLVRALSQSGSRVLVVAQDELSKGRSNMGWDEINYGGADLLTSPRSEDLARILGGRATPSTHHIFSGLDVYPMVAAARRLVNSHAHGHIFMTTESWDERGVAGSLRSAKYRHRARSMSEVDTLLTIGIHARKQFQRILPKSVRRADFGYFVDEPKAATLAAPRAAPGTLEFLFVGSLSRLKQVDALLQNLRALPRRDWRATIIGDGPLITEARAAERALPDNIRVLGTVSNSTARSAMAAADVLILPSAYDGWGAVVSEALMTGTQVLVSDAVGAADLVNMRLAGSVFSATSGRSFQHALMDTLQTGRLEEDDRQRLRKWAREHISPQVAANYLHELARNPTADVEAPWQDESPQYPLRRTGHVS